MDDFIDQKNVNDEKVFACLEHHYPFPINRPRITNQTGLARSTIFYALKRLELKGRVVSFPLKKPQRGRPSTFYFSVNAYREERRQWREFAQTQASQTMEDAQTE